MRGAARADIERSARGGRALLPGAFEIHRLSATGNRLRIMLPRINTAMQPCCAATLCRNIMLRRRIYGPIGALRHGFALCAARQSRSAPHRNASVALLEPETQRRQQFSSFVTRISVCCRRVCRLGGRCPAEARARCNGGWAVRFSDLSHKNYVKPRPMRQLT